MNPRSIQFRNTITGWYYLEVQAFLHWLRQVCTFRVSTNDIISLGIIAIVRTKADEVVSSNNTNEVLVSGNRLVCIEGNETIACTKGDKAVVPTKGDEVAVRCKGDKVAVCTMGDAVAVRKKNDASISVQQGRVGRSSSARAWATKWLWAWRAKDIIS